MNHVELREMIAANRRPEDCIIKWWGNDKTLVDYELIDRFLERCDLIPDVAGFELFDMEMIWKVLVELDPDPLSRERIGNLEMIQWRWRDRQGNERLAAWPFTPEGIMALMESEFFD